MQQPGDAAQQIANGAREILTAYPLAAGLTPVADVVNHFPPPRPLPPSLFAPSSSRSLRAGPEEPLLAQYENEITALLSREQRSPEAEAWRQDELSRAAAAMALSTEVLRTGAGALRFPHPPFPLTVQPRITPASPSSSFSSQLLHSLSFPYPSPAPTTAPSTPIDPSTSPAFFQDFLASHSAQRASHPLATSSSLAPPFSNGSNHLAAPTSSLSKISNSSPDPLRISASSSRSHANGSTFAAPVAGPSTNHRKRHSPPSTNTPSPTRPFGSGSPHKSSNSSRSFSIEIPTTTGAQKRSLHVKLKSMTESQRATSRGLMDEDNAFAEAAGLSQRTPRGESGVESPMKKIRLTSGSGGTTGRGTVRTGDTKDVIDRLSDLVSDIFSADDGFIGDTSTSHLASTSSASPSKSSSTPLFRSTATTTDGQPLLKTETLKKLVRFLNTVATQEKGEEMLEDLEEAGLARLLKLLERSWVACDGLEFWDGAATSSAKAEKMEVPAPKKGKGKAKGKKAASRRGSKDIEEDEDEDGGGEGSNPSERRSSRSRSPTARPSTEDDMDVDGDEDFWTDDSLQQVSDGARLATDALIALRAALTILTSARLSKRLYSADYLAAMLATLRHTGDALLFPILSAPSTSHLADLSSLESDALSGVCDALNSVIPSFSRLIEAEELSEDLVISTIYFALSPFFHEVAPSATAKGRKADSGGVINVAMKGIRMACLGLVRTVFGRYPDQRAWVVEEVFNNVARLEMAKKIKGTFRLRTGVLIHTVSALILHLVQTCAADLASQMHARITAPARAKHGDVEMRESQDADVQEESEDDGPSPLESATRDLLDPAVDEVNKSARTIIGFLLQKSCKSGKSSSNEAEYRNVLDNLIADALATLHLPEWPGAEILLSVCAKSMMSQLADTKTTHEANALKGVSLDHLGPIGARIRHDLTLSTKNVALKTLSEILADKDVAALETVFAAQQEILTHLEKTEKTSGEGAAQFVRALFGRDLIQLAKAATNDLEKYSPTDLEHNDEGKKAKALADRLAILSKDLWNTTAPDDVFGPGTDDEQPRIDLLNIQRSRSQPLVGLYQALLARVVAASESSAVSFRTKSLRGISLFVAEDPELFLEENVSASIQNRIVDASPAVRDTAIELVGKYVIGRPALAIKYLPRISSRITDTGLNVRRRVVKLLKVLFAVVDQEDLQVDICRKLIWRALDDDEGVKDLAIEAIEDIWFAPPARGRAALSDDSHSAAAKADIARLATIIRSVAGRFSDQPPPVENVLCQIIAKDIAKNTKPPLGRLRDVMESLIDDLIEADTSASTHAVECIRTIYALSAADPSLLSLSKTALLLPFLKSASSVEEHILSDYLLKIFRSTVTALPKGSSQFSRSLQAALIPMINKPSPNMAYQQEVVACFCAVVRGQTHDFPRMINIYKACVGRLWSDTRKLRDASTASKVDLRYLPMFAQMSALLVEHGQFDQIRESYPDTKDSLDAISAASIHEHLFTVLTTLYNVPAAEDLRPAVLSSLGYLYRAFPSLMLKPASMSILDAIFNSEDEKLRYQVLRILQDFLASQERAPAVTITSNVKVETGVKIDELVGNVEGFAASGVGGAIAQRYLKQIFNASMSTTARLQRTAVDVLTSVARSGFGHPLMIAPVLVALSSTSDQQLASKAFATLTLLHSKHATLLAARFFNSAKTSHEYAQNMAGSELVHGYHVESSVSHFGRWYSLYQKEKRQHQMDYLKVITRHTFELNTDSPCTEEDVSFVRYVAEALSTLEYKRQEEPMCIIHYLNAALAVTGVQVLHLLQDGLEGGGGLMASITPSASQVSAPNGSPTKANGSPTKKALAPSSSLSSVHSEGIQPSRPPTPSLARQSVICGIALLLRDHLKSLYSLTDAKLAKYTLGKKCAQGDRPTVRRAEVPLALGSDDYARLPYALAELDTPEHLIEQRDTYIALIADDGTVGALEELEVDDDT